MSNEIIQKANEYTRINVECQLDIMRYILLNSMRGANRNRFFQLYLLLFACYILQVTNYNL
jgi:hypothetical protein